MFVTRNPATGDRLGEYSPLTGDEMAAAVKAADAASHAWARSAVNDRTGLVRNLGQVLAQNVDEYALRITREMGKPIGEARAEVQKSANACTWFADTASAMLEPEYRTTDAQRSYVRLDALGPVLAIMPWNYPFWQALRCAIPSFLVGNSVLHKPAPATIDAGMALEEAITKAGAPAGLFRTLPLTDDQSADVIADDRVRMVTLTGSPQAGGAVAEVAGRYRTRSLLELGGSDPFIVLDDADVQRAAATGVRARMQNCGQSCIAAKRFIVASGVADAFAEAFAAELSQLTVGDPTLEETTVGPMARADLRDAVDAQVRSSVDHGATVVSGGRPVDGPGYYYEPTLLTDVTPDHPVAVDETFGPVAAILTVRDANEAVEVANASRFGLGASIWTEDRDRGEALSELVETGQVFVNSMVKSDPRLPFGGVKDSGYGRELAGDGLRELANVKTVWVE